jgi:hypothetical protein
MILYPSFEKRHPLCICSLVEFIWREDDNNQHPRENLETRRKDHLCTHGEKQRRRYPRQDWCSALIDSHSWGPAGKKRNTWTYSAKISEYWILDLSHVGDSPNHWDISITSLHNRRLNVLIHCCQDFGKFRLGLPNPFLFQRNELFWQTSADFQLWVLHIMSTDMIHAVMGPCMCMQPFGPFL